MFELFEVYPLSDITKFKIEYVSIFSQYQNRWVICHLKNTDKWDCPGGKIEFNERPLQAAMRELFEETGTVEADFLPLFIYCINSDKGLTYGIQYFSEIVELEDLPDYEMDKIEFHHQIPFEKLKTPEAHKKLFTYVHQIINSGII